MTENGVRSNKDLNPQAMARCRRIAPTVVETTEDSDKDATLKERLIFLVLQYVQQVALRPDPIRLKTHL